MRRWSDKLTLFMTISDFLVLVTIVLTLVTIAVSNNKKNMAV